MALRNRWIVRTINAYDFLAPEGATFCVECRATNAIAFYGTMAECQERARALNAG
jgi:hypothetical protein